MSDNVVEIFAGAPGPNGWSPILAATTDGERRVLRVSDWTGGSGNKPAIGQYVGASGLTSVLADAVDVRGAAGAGGGGGGAVSSVNTQTGAVVLTQDNIADGTTAKQFTATEKTKLSGVASGATANDTDANLKNRANHTGTQTASTISDFSTAADARITAQKGAANGLATLDGTSKIPAAQLPSYVDDILEYANYAALPGTGETGKIYVTLDTNFEYRWSGSAYIRIVSSPGTTDELAEGATNKYYTTARAAAKADIAGATFTGAVAATNLSGTNTGDQTNITGNAGTVSTISGLLSSSSEIALNGGGTSASPYNFSVSSGVVTSGLLAEYRMEDGTGTSLKDSSGNNNNGAFPGGSNNPAWTSLGLRFNPNGTVQYIDLPTNLNTAKTMQIFCIPAQIISEAGGMSEVPGSLGQHSLVVSNNATTGPNFMAEMIPGTTLGVSPSSYAGGMITTVQDTWGGAHLFTLAMGLANDDTIYVDDQKITDYTARGSTQGRSVGTAGSFYRLGGHPTNGGGWAFVGNMYFALFYDRVLTQAEVIKNYNAVWSRLQKRGITRAIDFSTSTSNQLLEVGDSLTYGLGVTNSWASVALVTGTDDTYNITKMGFSGYRVAFLRTMAETVWPKFLSRRANKNVITIFCGTNDITDGIAASIVYQNIVHFCREMRSRCSAASINLRIHVMTMGSRTGQDTGKNALNLLLRQNHTQFCDRLVDFAALPACGADGAYANTSGVGFQGDGIHFNQALHNALAPIHVDALNDTWFTDLKTPFTFTGTTKTMLAKECHLRFGAAATAATTLTLITAIGKTGQDRIVANDNATYNCVVKDEAGTTLFTLAPKTVQRIRCFMDNSTPATPTSNWVLV